MIFASPGALENSAQHSLHPQHETLTGVLPSLVFVWPSNCGLASLTETIAARPSRASSPVSFSSPLSSFLSAPYLFTTPVSAARTPSSWVPPSCVLMVLANVYTLSPYDSFHCIAISTDMRSPSAANSTTDL